MTRFLQTLAYSAHESLMLSHCLKHFPLVKWAVATLETPVLRRSKENKKEGETVSGAKMIWNFDECLQPVFSWQTSQNIGHAQYFAPINSKTSVLCESLLLPPSNSPFGDNQDLLRGSRSSKCQIYKVLRHSSIILGCCHDRIELTAHVFMLRVSTSWLLDLLAVMTRQLSKT